MEKILSLSTAKAKLNQLVDDVMTKEDEFMITKNGEVAAILIHPALFESWRETKEIKANNELVKEIKAGIKRLKQGGKRYTFEEVFGEALA